RPARTQPGDGVHETFFHHHDLAYRLEDGAGDALVVFRHIRPPSDGADPRLHRRRSVGYAPDHPDTRREVSHDARDWVAGRHREDQFGLGQHAAEVVKNVIQYLRLNR